MKLAPGESFGRYLVKRRLGAGGMAEVYAVAKLGPGAWSNYAKHLALKLILPHHARDPAFVGRFVDEMKLAAQLEHPNIVGVPDYGEAEGSGVYYLVLELVRGLDLRQLSRELARQAREPEPPHPRYPGQELGRLPADVVAYIMMMTAEALAYAHQSELRHGVHRNGVIHRDLSADNLMADVAGHVKVMDWGIAKAFKTDVGALSRTKHAIGKLTYMPPEQFAGGMVDPRADLYALGIVGFRLLTGRHPYQGSGQDANEDQMVWVARARVDARPPIAEAAPHVPEPLREVLDRLIRANPAERYRSAAALLDALSPLVPNPRATRHQLGALVRRVYAGDLDTQLEVQSQPEGPPAPLPMAPSVTGEPAPTGPCATAPATPMSSAARSADSTCALQARQGRPTAQPQPLDPFIIVAMEHSSRASTQRFSTLSTWPIQARFVASACLHASPPISSRQRP